MYSKIDYIVVVSGLLVLFSFVFLWIRGKKVTGDKVIRYIPILFVFITVASVLLLNRYYENQLKETTAKLQNIQQRLVLNNLDSLSFTKEERILLLDSLKKVEKELDKLLLDIRKQEKVTGDKAELILNIQNAIKNTNKEIYKIETYNEILDSKEYSNKWKGYVIKNSNTSSFVFQPPLETKGEYLDFVIKFQDEKLINKIAVIYLEVHKEDENGKLIHIYDQYYKPQKGINAFRIKNYLKEPNTKMSLGFFWKSEFEKKDYPTYERIVYYLH